MNIRILKQRPGIAACLICLALLLSSSGVHAEDLEWHNLKELTVEGMGWSDTATPWERLPARASETVDTKTLGLSKNTAGINVRFISDAPLLYVRWTLTEEPLHMFHMSPLTRSGMDLYAKHEGRWRWLGFAAPDRFPENEKLMVSGIPAERREFMIYLPPYNGVLKAEIGVPRGSLVAPASPREAKPIVFYGTSITQGGCASRPGMIYTSILGRRLDRPVINLGFSGSGRMQEPVIELVAELDAAVFFLDNLPNMSEDALRLRVVPTVRRLREAHPDTPIILIEDRNYANAWLVKRLADRHRTSRAALREGYEQLVAEGVKGLYYIEGPPQLGADDESCVDGSHASDLGMVQMADCFEPVIRRALEESGQ